MAVLGAVLLLLVLAFAGCIGKTTEFFSGPEEVEAKSWGSGWNPTLRTTFGDPATSLQEEWPDPVDVAATVYDFDGDGHQEVVVQARDARVHVYDSASGKSLASLPVTVASGWKIERILNKVSVGVLAPGEPASIVAASHAAYIAAWTFNPAKSDDAQFTFDLAWEKRTTGCSAQPSMDSAAVLADLDGIPGLEVLAQTEEVGLFALSGSDGSLLWKHCWTGGNADPVAADLDGDGQLEAIFASDSGLLAVFNGADGKQKWTFDARASKYGIQPASISVAPVVAELDGTAPKEVLFTARHAPGGTKEDWPSYHMAIFAVHAKASEPWKGEALWVKQPSWAHPLSYTHLVVKDVDDDGEADIFGMDWNTIGHLPGDWESLGAAHLFRLDSKGEDVWTRELNAWWSNKDIAVGDFDGDGKMEVLANGHSAGRDGFWRINAATGNKEGWLFAQGWTVQRGPVITDIEGDGMMDVLLTVEPMAKDRDDGAVLVLSLGVPFKEADAQ